VCTKGTAAEKLAQRMLANKAETEIEVVGRIMK
jgi:hypothetical protein